MITLSNRLELFTALPAGTVGAEIGVYRGQFSAQILSTPVAHLWCIDPWQKQGRSIYNDSMDDDDHGDNYRETLRNTDAHGANLGRVTIIQGFSAKVAHNESKIPPLDWVYIDGNHSYMAVMEDLICWSRRLKPDGVIFGHDYTRNSCAQQYGFGVIEAVDDFCRNCGWEIIALAETANPEDFTSYSLRRLLQNKTTP